MFKIYGLEELIENRLKLIRDIKILLGIPLEDNSKDELFEIYIRRAVYTIHTYLNNEKFTAGDIEDVFSEAVISLVTNVHREITTGTKGIKSQSQGARSVTYSDDIGFTISNDIKTMLPVPYIRLR